MYETLKRLQQAKATHDDKTANKITRTLNQVGMDSLTIAYLLNMLDRIDADAASA